VSLQVPRPGLSRGLKPKPVAGSTDYLEPVDPALVWQQTARSREFLLRCNINLPIHDKRFHWRTFLSAV